MKSSSAPKKKPQHICVSHETGYAAGTDGATLSMFQVITGALIMAVIGILILLVKFAVSKP